MDYKFIAEDSKTKVYLSLVREFNEAEYEKYYLRKKREKMRKRIFMIARIAKYTLPVFVTIILYLTISQRLYLERGSYAIGSEFLFTGIVGIGTYLFLDWLIGGDEN